MGMAVVWKTPIDPSREVPESVWKCDPCPSARLARWWAWTPARRDPGHGPASLGEPGAK